MVPEGNIIHWADKNYTVGSQEFWSRWASIGCEHPVIQYVARGGDRPLVTISNCLTQSKYRELELYGEVFKPNGINTQIAVVVPLTESALVATLSSDKPFRQDEKDWLMALHPHLLPAYTHYQERLHEKGQLRVSSNALEAARVGIISSTGKGRMRLANQKALTWVRRYFLRPVQSLADLPQTIKEAVAKNRNGSAEIPGADGILRIDWTPAEDSGAVLVLTERRSNAVKEKARAYGLSPRECEVAHWLVLGKTNDEISALLGISRHTSRTHVENIFFKLQVPTRTAAAAKLLEGTR